MPHPNLDTFDCPDSITAVMRRMRKVKPDQENNFGMATAASVIRQFNQITGTVALVMVVISSIGLLVGGIGVMNIMLVSVTERTREIGVRKALGATRRNILFQFLVESLTLCVLGGALGVGFGYLTAHVMSALAKWNTLVAPSAVIVALLFSAGVGLFFGILPAQRAAKLDPIEALRYE